MRAILINPFDRTATEIDLQPGLPALYAALSGPGFPVGEEFPLDPTKWEGLERERIEVDCIDIVSLGGGQDLVVDDVGRFRDCQACFCFMGGQPLAGRALIYSHDPAGEARGTTLPLPELMEKLDWLPYDADYSPPPPVVMGFDSFDAMLAAVGPSGPAEPTRTSPKRPPTT